MATMAMPFYECREGIYEIDEFECTEIFVVTGSEGALVLDTGTGIGDLKELIETRITSLPYDVLLTHNHVDHMGGAGWFEKVYMHPLDLEHDDPAFPPTLEQRKRFAKVMREGSGKYYSYTEEDIRPWPKAPEKLPVEDGHVFHLGGRDLIVFHCPGHTAGELVVLDEKTGTLLCGDAFNGNFLLDSSRLNPDRREMAWTCLEAMRRIEKMRGSYNSVYNFHHDYRGYGSPLSPDLMSNQITNLERILSGKADFRVVPDPLNPETPKCEAVYRNSTINLVGGDIREIAP